MRQFAVGSRKPAEARAASRPNAKSRARAVRCNVGVCRQSLYSGGVVKTFGATRILWPGSFAHPPGTSRPATLLGAVAYG